MIEGSADQRRSLDIFRGRLRRSALDKPRNKSVSKERGATLRMNLRASAGQITFVGSPNIRCKIRDRLRNEVRKRSASTVRYSWRVSEAFTR